MGLYRRLVSRQLLRAFRDGASCPGSPGQPGQGDLLLRACLPVHLGRTQRALGDAPHNPVDGLCRLPYPTRARRRRATTRKNFIGLSTRLTGGTPGLEGEIGSGRLWDLRGGARHGCGIGGLAW
jgi:hypothetical protein